MCQANAVCQTSIEGSFFLVAFCYFQLYDITFSTQSATELLLRFTYRPICISFYERSSERRKVRFIDLVMDVRVKIGPHHTSHQRPRPLLPLSQYRPTRSVCMSVCLSVRFGVSVPVSVSCSSVCGRRPRLEHPNNGCFSAAADFSLAGSLLHAVGL